MGHPSLQRDINAGRFADNTSLVLVTHGLALRIFLMRWFHWTVDQFMDVFNPVSTGTRAVDAILFELQSCLASSSCAGATGPSTSSWMCSAP